MRTHVPEGGSRNTSIGAARDGSGTAVRVASLVAAPHEMRRVLRATPDDPGGARGWRGGPAVHRWRHGALHDVVAPMREHVVMAYFDTPRRIDRTSGRSRVRSVTTNDTVTVIPAGQAARWDIEEALDVVHVYVAPEYLVRAADTAGEGGASAAEPWDAVAAPHPRLATLVRLLAHELEQHSTRDTLHADALAELVALELLRPAAGRRASVASSALATSGDGLARWQVRRVTEYMDAHLERPLALAELAGLLGLTPKHFCTAFRRATGLPPHAWLQRHRVGRAQGLLRDPGEGLTAIAGRLGYASHSAFTAAFRRATGRTPTAWRREHGPA